MQEIIVKNKIKSDTVIIALGADIKGSICLFDGTKANIFTGFGDLSVPVNFRKYHKSLENLKLTHNFDLAVYDAHPDYISSRQAMDLLCPKVSLQHHYAHILSCIAENNISDEPVIGIAADGTGFGTDGAIWGCEIIKYQTDGQIGRIGHLGYFNLFGGDLSAIQTWRPAAGILKECFGDNFILDNVSNEKVEIAKQAFNSGNNITKTSSLGRLFDAVAFILGLCSENKTEAQAAIALENTAAKADKKQILPYNICNNSNGLMELDFKPMIMGIIDMKKTDNIANISMAFHLTVAKMICDAVVSQAQKNNIKSAALSGGCFLNRILSDEINRQLGQGGLKVYKNNKLSTGDECIALGQVFYGMQYFANKKG